MSTDAAPVQTAQPETNTTTVPATAEVNPEALAAYTEAVTSFRPPAEIERLKAEAFPTTATTTKTKTTAPAHNARRAEAILPSTDTPHEEIAAATAQDEEHADEHAHTDILAADEHDPETATAPTSERPDDTETEAEQPHESETPPGAQPTDKGEKEASRFRFQDPTDRLIAQTAKTLKISLAEAARRIAGETAPAKAGIPHLAPQPQPEPASEPAVASIQAELAEVRSRIRQFKGGGGTLSTPELDDLEYRRTELVAELAAAKAEAKAQANAQKVVQVEMTQKEFDRARARTVTDTIQVYPEMARPESAQFRIAKAIGLEWRDPNHPHHAKLFQPDGPRLVAEAAARQLGIKPLGAESSASRSGETKAAAAAAKSKPGPAPGTRGSAAPPPAKTQAELNAELETQAQAIIAGKVKVSGAPQARSYIM